MPGKSDVPHVTLYPLLLKLEHEGAMASEWGAHLLRVRRPNAWDRHPSRYGTPKRQHPQDGSEPRLDLNADPIVALREAWTSGSIEIDSKQSPQANFPQPISQVVPKVSIVVSQSARDACISRSMLPAVTHFVVHGFVYVGMQFFVDPAVPSRAIRDLFYIFLIPGPALQSVLSRGSKEQPQIAKVVSRRTAEDGRTDRTQ